MLNTAKACLTEEELLVAEAELEVGQLTAFCVNIFQLFVSIYFRACLAEEGFLIRPKDGSEEQLGAGPLMAARR